MVPVGKKNFIRLSSERLICVLTHESCLWNFFLIFVKFLFGGGGSDPHSILLYNQIQIRSYTPPKNLQTKKKASHVRWWTYDQTRMHSSGMRTRRLLTISQHALYRGCVYPSMYWAGGCLPRGVSASGPGGWQTPPLCEQNDKQVQKH